MAIVTTKYGQLRGVDMGEYIEYRGVPYAKPPVGDLRWKAPVEPDAWEGIYEADTWNKKCMQMTFEGEGDNLYGKEFYSNPDFNRESDEDCLYINIGTPKNYENKKMPVAFWIHGGAFLGGYNSEMEFGGEAYCKRGVILVSVEYRCNIFGFLAHPWLAAEDPNGRAGNYGILDQIAALKWVYENIENFGGDKDNITVFGQSAGAMSAQTLISSDATENMIAKAIFQSGGAYAGGLSRDILQKTQESYGEVFAEIAGVKTLEEMRALSAEKVMELMGPFMSRMMPVTKGLFLTPVNDGYVLDDDYDALIDKGRIKNIPYMLGTTKDDILTTPEMVAAGQKTTLYDGCVTFSLKQEEQGRKPSYVYYFTRDLPGDNAGAFHSAELWYTFGTLGRCWRPMEDHDYALADQMVDYWTNFMKTGDPNGEGLPVWEPCTKENPVIKEFN